MPSNYLSFEYDQTHERFLTKQREDGMCSCQNCGLRWAEYYKPYADGKELFQAKLNFE